jgi:hypothetical protein
MSDKVFLLAASVDFSTIDRANVNLHNNDRYWFRGSVICAKLLPSIFVCKKWSLICTNQNTSVIFFKHQSRSNLSFVPLAAVTINCDRLCKVIDNISFTTYSLLNGEYGYWFNVVKREPTFTHEVTSPYLTFYLCIWMLCVLRWVKFEAYMKPRILVVVKAFHPKHICIMHLSV